MKKLTADELFVRLGIALILAGVAGFDIRVAAILAGAGCIYFGVRSKPNATG